MNINLYSILNEAEKKFRSFACNEFLAKSSALIDSTLQTINFSRWGDVDRHSEIKVILNDVSKTTLVKLLVLSYYVPENLGWFIRSAIHDEIHNNIDFVELEFPLTSKNHFMIWISDRIQRRGPHWFFGNFCNEKDWNLFPENGPKAIRLKIRRNHKRYNDTLPEKRTIGVGYKDKGTLPKDARGGMKNFILTSVQNEIELNRDICETTRYLIEGFLM